MVDYFLDVAGEEGLLQPIIVHKLNGDYELIAGQRRLTALNKLGRKIMLDLRYPTKWSAHKKKRFLSMVEKNHTPEFIAHYLGTFRPTIRRLMNDIEEGVTGTERMKAERAKYNSRENRRDLKPEGDTSQRKERTCNGPNCDKKFISQHFGHRNCGCCSGVYATAQELYCV